MEHQLTITLPNAVFHSLVEAALRQGQTPEELVAEHLIETLPAATAHGAERKGDITRFFGMWDSGDPHFADNERIDADLARAYGAEPSLAELFGSVDLGRPTGADNESIDRDLARAQ